MNQLDLLYSIDISYPGENSILIEWPEKICVKQHRQIIACQQQVNTLLAEFIIDSIASYNSLMIYYSLEKLFEKRSLKQFVAMMSEIIADVCGQSQKTDNITAPELLETSLEVSLQTKLLKTIEIPVYYGEEAGWDLRWVAEQSALSVEEVIELHSQTTYRAYALGFTPGFCYLASLHEKLRHARRQSPRVVVPKGAVAIAEQQTAIYPNISPGGWHIIGQTPMAMYKTGGNSPLLEPSLLAPSLLDSAELNRALVRNNDQPSFLPTIAVGQEISFKAISYQEFCQLGGVLALENDPPENNLSEKKPPENDLSENKPSENDPLENKSSKNKLQAS